jgi:hypothetical protein
MPPTLTPFPLSALTVFARTVVFPVPGLPVRINTRFSKAFTSA